MQRSIAISILALLLGMPLYAKEQVAVYRNFRVAALPDRKGNLNPMLLYGMRF
jgi:hypothetical protein